MRIMLVTGAIKAENSTRHYFTGLDLVVTQLGEMLNNENEIFFFTTSPIGKNATSSVGLLFSYGNLQLIKSFYEIKLKQLKAILFSKIGIKEKIKGLRSIVISKRFEKAIRDIEPDIVHINGIAFTNLLCAAISAKYDIPVAFTLHGLSYKASDTSEFQKQIEIEFLKTIVRKKTLFSVVSSGVMKKIEQEIGTGGNIRIIPNTLDIVSCKKKKREIREEIGILDDSFVLICVGTIGEHKNQKQILRAFSGIAEKENIILILAGQNKLGNELFKEIDDRKVSSRVIITGFVSKERLSELYTCSDANIVASKSEGFGLSIIEAGAYGLPTILFEDLDALDDLYFSEGFVICKKRTDEALRSGIQQCIETKWEHNQIAKIVKERNPDIRELYLRFYSDVISDSKCMSEQEILTVVGKEL